MPVRPQALHDLVREHLARAASGWSLGTFGALAEFHRAEGEPATLAGSSVVTARGAIAVALPPEAVAVAYERPLAAPDAWAHGVAFCLPRAAARGAARRALTELGPDRDALDAADRGAILFDLGVGAPHCDCLIRVADPAHARRIREWCGRSLLGDGAPALAVIAALDPHRVFVSPLGRIEVRQPIPAADGRSPEGPHTHFLPRLLRLGRTHSANLALPAGLVPCLELHPPSPIQDALGRPIPYDAARHAAFDALLERYGEPEYVAAKRAASRAVAAGKSPRDDDYATRRARLARRVAVRQALHRRQTA